MTQNLEYYKVFYYVAKYGSLTEAAKVLMVSQPAVSQAVHQLEQAVGIKLFQRVPRGVTLTKEAQLLFSYVSRGYEEIEAGEAKLRQMLNLEIGEIRIGASDMTLQFYLLPYLERFHEMYPSIKVTVTNAPTPETLINLRNQTIDFGIISTPFENQEGIQSIEVREIADTFVAGRKYFRYRNKMMDFKELEKLPIILLEKNTSTRSYIDAFMAENGVVLQPEFELATSDMIVQFALKNLGIGCVMRDFASSYIENGMLFELRFAKMIRKRHFCIVTDSDGVLTTAAKNLLKIVQEDLR